MRSLVSLTAVPLFLAAVAAETVVQICQRDSNSDPDFDWQYPGQLPLRQPANTPPSQR